MEDTRSAWDRVYQSIIVEGGSAVVVFAFAGIAAIIVGIVAPTAGLAIMALGVLAAMIISFSETGVVDDAADSPSKRRAKSAD